MDAMAMTPYLHFTRGDYLLFKTWKPSSAGAVVGACLGLVCLAILDRWLSAVRIALNYHWRHRGLLASRTPNSTNARPNNSDESKRGETSSEGSNPGPAPRIRYTRIIPPFILAHDLPRGLLSTCQALLEYALMLSVMTFNVAYVLSVIAGLSIGETVFGRMGTGKAH